MIELCETCCKEYTAAQEEFFWRDVELALPEAVPSSDGRWQTESFGMQVENSRVERGACGVCTVIVEGRFRLVLRIGYERLVVRFRRRLKIPVACAAVDCGKWRITGTLTELRLHPWRGTVDVGVRIELLSCCETNACPELSGTWECCSCSCSCGGSGSMSGRPWVLPDGSIYYSDYACPCGCGRGNRPRRCGCGR